MINQFLQFLASQKFAAGPGVSRRRRGSVRSKGAESLEQRNLLTPTLQDFLTTEHVDINIGRTGGVWSVGPRDADASPAAVQYSNEEALIYVGGPSGATRPGGDAFNFIGVDASAPYYRLPLAQDPNLLYLGVAAYDVTLSDVDRYNPSVESKGRVTGNGRWLRLSRTGVSHFESDGDVGNGVFSMWQSGDSGPNVFVSSYNDGTSNPNAAGLDTTDGITADDSFWVLAGGHIHYNYGFSQPGRYEVTLRASGYFGDDGNASTPNGGGFSQSGDITIYFSVLNVGQIEFDASSYTVDEHSGTASVRVRRTGGSDGRISAVFATSDGTAISPADYTATLQTVTFNDRETEKFVTIPIVDDEVDEPAESVLLALSAPGPASIAAYYTNVEERSLLGALSTATLSIIDNDNPANLPPTISDVGDQSTDEDTATGAIPFTVGDVETAAGSLVVTATSSNTALVSDGNIALGGSGANRTVTITPAANLSGSTTITLTVTDAGGLTATDTFVLTVAGVNDVPFAVDDVFTVTPGNTVRGNLLLNDSDPNGDLLTAVSVATTTKGALVLNADGTFAYTPGTTFNGTDRFTYRASDGGLESAITTVTIHLPGDQRFDATLTTEHVDIGITYEDGAWDLHVHDEENDEEYEPYNAVFQVGAAAITTRTGALEDSVFDFLAVAPGQSFYQLSQSPNPELIYLGIATEEISDSTFLNDQAGLYLKAVNGPGHFSMWESTDTGPDLLMSTTDGITFGDQLLIQTGTHAHFNYAFSARGSYDVTFEAVATLPDGTITSSGDVTYRFVVNTAAIAVNDSYNAIEDMPLTVGAGSGLLSNDTDFVVPESTAWKRRTSSLRAGLNPAKRRPPDTFDSVRSATC